MKRVYLYQPPHQRLQIFALENSLWIHMLRFYDKLPKRKTNINNLLQSRQSKQGYLKENCPIPTFSENKRFSSFSANTKGHRRHLNTVMDYRKQLDMCKISVIHVQDLTDNPLDCSQSSVFSIRLLWSRAKKLAACNAQGLIVTCTVLLV